eukprot:403363162
MVKDSTKQEDPTNNQDTSFLSKKLNDTMMQDEEEAINSKETTQNSTSATKGGNQGSSSTSKEKKTKAIQKTNVKADKDSIEGSSNSISPGKEGDSKQNQKQQSSNNKSTKESTVSKEQADDLKVKYNKLKKKYRYLAEEFSKLMESWEQGTKSMKIILEERKFLKKKLDSFYKSQHSIDDQIFKQHIQEQQKTDQGQKQGMPNSNNNGMNKPGQISSSGMNSMNNQPPKQGIPMSAQMQQQQQMQKKPNGPPPSSNGIATNYAPNIQTSRPPQQAPGSYQSYSSSNPTTYQNNNNMMNRPGANPGGLGSSANGSTVYGNNNGNSGGNGAMSYYGTSNPGYGGGSQNQREGKGSTAIKRNVAFSEETQFDNDLNYETFTGSDGSGENERFQSAAPIRLLNRELKKDYIENQSQYQFVCFYLGMFTYLGWSTVTSYSNNIATTFNKDHLFFEVYIAMNFFMAFMRIAHILFMFSISYHVKIWLFTLISMCAFILMGISILNKDEEYAFYLCLVSCSLHGIAHAFGESVLLGFFKFFPSDAVCMFATGTGFSDIFALMFILLFLNLGGIFGKAFLLLSFMIIPFAYSFSWINHKKQTLIGTNEELQMKYGLDADQNPNRSLVPLSSESNTNLEVLSNEDFDEEEVKRKIKEAEESPPQLSMFKALSNKIPFEAAQRSVIQLKNSMAKALSQNNFRIQNIYRVYKQIRRLFYNQFVVTFTSDFIISFLIYYQVQFKLQQLATQRPLDYEQQKIFAEKYEYLLLQIANAIGSFIARSQTNLVIMQRPLSMSLLQSINLLFVLLNIYVLKFNSFSFLLIFMLYSGYIGGSVYLNTFFIITQKRTKDRKNIQYYNKIEQVAFEDQEIAINVALVGMDLGYMVSSIFGFALYFYFDY